MSKKIFIFLIFFTLLFSLTAVSAEGDLKGEIDNATDEVSLDSTYSVSSQITIDKELTLKGNNTVIDAGGSSRIFNVKKETSFENITFKNAKSRQNGGAIYSTAKMTFKNCIFTGNSADEGSAIYSKSDVTLINCTFISNKGSAIYFTGDFLNVTSSSFEKNRGENVIFAWSECEITDSTFTNNKGYAIYSVFDTVTENCTFKDNQRGIYAQSNLGVVGCDFTNTENAVIKSFENGGVLYLTECLFANITSDMGSAVYSLTDAVIANSTFKNNKNSEGAAVMLLSFSDEPFYKAEVNEFYIINCTFKNNTGFTSAAIDITDDNNLTVAGCLFENNTAEYGAVIYASGSYIELSENTLKNNSPASISLTNYENYMAGYTAEAILLTDDRDFTGAVILDDSMKSVDIISVTTSAVKTSYRSGAKLTVKLVNKYTKKPVADSQIDIKVGKKHYDAYTNSKGVASFDISKVNAGSYTVTITSDYGVCKIPKTKTTAKIAKAKPKVKAPKVTNKYKKSKYFKVTVKLSKKGVKGLVLKLKIGKKTYNVKTDSKGVAKFNTKKLKRGSYKVTVTSGNANYKILEKSRITIRR